MLRKLLISVSVLIALGWFILPPIAFHSPAVVTSWFSLLSPSMQQSYAFEILLSNDEADYKKAVLLNAWLNDFTARDRKFKIDDLDRLVPVTKMGGEALSEPVGLTAARIIIESKDCKAIGQLIAFYRLNEVATSELKTRMARRDLIGCQGL